MRPTLTIALALAAVTAVVSADDLADRIRVQEKALGKSVAWIRLVTSAEEEGGEDVSGVCSGPVIFHGGRPVVLAPDIEDRLKSVKILRDDGQEQEAEVLAHDSDLGLMFVVAKDVKASGLMPSEAPKAAKDPQLGDPLLLIDRRSHGSPDETVCRLVRVCCVMERPERAWLYNGISPQQMGGLVVTPSGEVVGVVAHLKDRDADGEEMTIPAVLPIERVLSSVQALQTEVPKAPEKSPEDPKEAPKKEEKP